MNIPPEIISELIDEAKEKYGVVESLANIGENKAKYLLADGTLIGTSNDVHHGDIGELDFLGAIKKMHNGTISNRDLFCKVTGALPIAVDNGSVRLTLSSRPSREQNEKIVELMNSRTDFLATDTQSTELFRLTQEEFQMGAYDRLTAEHFAAQRERI